MLKMIRRAQPALREGNVLVVVQSSAWQRAFSANPELAPTLMLGVHPVLLDILTRNAIPIGRCYTAVEMKNAIKNRFPLASRSKMVTPGSIEAWIDATKSRIKPAASILITDQQGWKSSNTLKHLEKEAAESTYVLRYKPLDEKRWAKDTDGYRKAVKHLYQNQPQIWSKKSAVDVIPAHSSSEIVSNKAISQSGTERR